MAHIYCLVPVFNEEPNLPLFLRNWQALRKALADDDLHLIAVDDGSRDNTAALLREAAEANAIEILSHGANHGPGHAFGTGLHHLSSRLDDDGFVITCEGDNTSRVETLLVMLERSRREKIDVVLASPYAYGGGIHNTSLLRVILSHGANGMLKGILGIHGIHTMSSFFRVHRATAIKRLQDEHGPRILVHDGFEGMVEMLIKITRLGMSVSEVPMLLDTSVCRGKSKMKVVRTILGYLRLYLSQRQWPDRGPKFIVHK